MRVKFLEQLICMFWYWFTENGLQASSKTSYLLAKQRVENKNQKKPKKQGSTYA